MRHIMTATEVLERNRLHDEAQRAKPSVMGDYLNMLVERCWDIMERDGLVPKRNSAHPKIILHI